jgi:general secretion pathway protein F
LFVLVAFVIPRFIPLFADAGAPLPVLTQAVFGIASLLQDWWWALVIAAAAGASGVKRWLASAENRQKLDRRLVKAPVVGDLVQGTEAVRFVRTLETLLRNGLLLLAALKLTRACSAIAALRPRSKPRSAPYARAAVFRRPSPPSRRCRASRSSS